MLDIDEMGQDEIHELLHKVGYGHLGFIHEGKPCVMPMHYYLENAKIKNIPGFSHEQFSEIYELQSLQRCFKACGSFASFMNQRGDTRYLKYLAPTLKRVLKSLARFPEYNIIYNLLSDAGALEKNFEISP